MKKWINAKNNTPKIKDEYFKKDSVLLNLKLNTGQTVSGWYNSNTGYETASGHHIHNLITHFKYKD